MSGSNRPLTSIAPGKACGNGQCRISSGQQMERSDSRVMGGILPGEWVGGKGTGNICVLLTTQSVETCIPTLERAE
ncbi:hypothetical protein Pta6605_16710 [Pseudomonas amygdali pv. tabaci]|nr:hypothetical protein Pta6605_16710 [Pseudomonas amygdali pv. tabaci]